MEDLKKRLHKLSVNWTDTSFEDEKHITSEIFKEVAIYVYTKMKNGEGINQKSDLKCIIQEVFRHCSYLDESEEIDKDQFRMDYIQFWENIRQEKLTGTNINELKNALCKSDFPIGNELYNRNNWSKPKAKQLLKLSIKEYKEYYWPQQRMTKNMEPFFIILFALKNTDEDYDSKLDRYKNSIINYKKILNDNVIAALDWILNCCIELYLYNKNTKLFDNCEITLSGLMSFLKRFNYSNYKVKKQFYELLKDNFHKPIELKNSSELVIEIQTVSLLEKMHTLLNKDSDASVSKPKELFKWLNPDKRDKLARSYMSNDKRMLKKYLSEYFEITDKKTDVIWDTLDLNYDVFDYTYNENYDENNSNDKEILQKHLQKYDSNFIYSVVLLALNAPLDNYLSIAEYSNISDNLRNTLPELEEPFNNREDSKNSKCIQYLQGKIASAKLFLAVTNPFCICVLYQFKYIYENPNDFLDENFIDRHEFWINKTYDELLLDIYTNIVK